MSDEWDTLYKLDNPFPVSFLFDGRLEKVGLKAEYGLKLAPGATPCPAIDSKGLPWELSDEEMPKEERVEDPRCGEVRTADDTPCDTVYFEVEKDGTVRYVSVHKYSHCRCTDSLDKLCVATGTPEDAEYYYTALYSDNHDSDYSFGEVEYYAERGGADIKMEDYGHPGKLDPDDPDRHEKIAKWRNEDRHNYEEAVGAACDVAWKGWQARVPEELANEIMHEVTLPEWDALTEEDKTRLVEKAKKKVADARAEREARNKRWDEEWAAKKESAQ